MTTTKPTRPAGVLHFELVRSASGSNIPESTDSVLVRVANVNGFDTVIAHVALPAPGATTEVRASVPADSGYTVLLLGVHDSRSTRSVRRTIPIPR